MAKQVGLDQYLYRNTATYGSPTWVIVENVRDLTASDTYAEADVSRRNTGASAYKQTEPTLREMSFEWDMVYDPSDADFTALLGFHQARTLVEFAFSDGVIATTGTKYFRIECKLFDFTMDEPLEDGKIVHVVAKPCYSSNAPVYTTV